MDYDATDIAERYDLGRRMSQTAMGVWLDAIAACIGARAVQSIVDVGCGTGRFSAALADQFGADVIGVDPSHTMLTKAAAAVRHPRVQFRPGAAERLPLIDASVGLVYLSMVYHHLSDPHTAAAEFARVLRSGGFLCIRNSTRELLDRVPYLRYFPAAAEINRRRLPSQDEIIRTMTRAGFLLLSHSVVEHRFAENHAEYCDKIARRALSDLVALPDRDFDTGLQLMRQALSAGEGAVFEPIDLFVFGRGPT